MPRRYADYPDALTGWNQLSSFGSVVSIVGVVVFLFVVYRTSTDEVPVSGNVWRNKEFFELESDPAKITSMEWTQQSPPALHTYNELPYLVSTSK